MLVSDLLFTFFFAVLFTFVFVVLLRTRGPWSGIPLFFVVLFLAIWAGGIWLSPFGAVVWSKRWQAFFFVGLFVSLLLAAAVASTPVEKSTVELVDVEKRKSEKKAVFTALSIFFWILVAALLAAIVVRYMY